MREVHCRERYSDSSSKALTFTSEEYVHISVMGIEVEEGMVLLEIGNGKSCRRFRKELEGKLSFRLNGAFRIIACQSCKGE